VPVTRQVTDYEDFPGRSESVHAVQVRARVTGYLDRVNFKEGGLVNEGDVLFEIDPRVYQAELTRTEALVAQAESRFNRLNSEYQRASRLVPTGAMTREEYERIAGERNEASSSIGVAKAERDKAALNVEFTKVRSSLSGRVSQRLVDPGNLVKADDTVPTTVVFEGRMFAYFNLDERTTLRVKRELREGKVDWPEEGFPVWMGLADQQGKFPYEGRIRFRDNRVDAETGTWRLRAVFDNSEGALTPGLYVRMHLPLGQPYEALLVAEQVLGTDQGQKYVYVVNEAGVDDAGKVMHQAEYRRVEVGRLHDGLRVILPFAEKDGRPVGLRPNERVVVSGLQRIRPGVPVAPKVVEMPRANGDKVAR
jgi:RND family efflux transporter MFP subunit